MKCQNIIQSKKRTEDATIDAESFTKYQDKFDSIVEKGDIDAQFFERENYFDIYYEYTYKISAIIKKTMPNLITHSNLPLSNDPDSISAAD